MERYFLYNSTCIAAIGLTVDDRLEIMYRSNMSLHLVNRFCTVHAIKASRPRNINGAQTSTEFESCFYAQDQFECL